LEIVKLCCGLRQEILDPETALALDQDDAGTLSKTGSIGGVTHLRKDTIDSLASTLPKIIFTGILVGLYVWDERRRAAG
jgi:hypothetical protein